MAFDEKCYELAVAFLSDDDVIDTETNRQTLAQAIQDAIELELVSMKVPE